MFSSMKNSQVNQKGSDKRGHSFAQSCKISAFRVMFFWFCGSKSALKTQWGFYNSTTSWILNNLRSRESLMTIEGKNSTFCDFISTSVSAICQFEVCLPLSDTSKGRKTPYGWSMSSGFLTSALLRWTFPWFHVGPQSCWLQENG